MIIRSTLYKYIFLIAHSCYGQFFYTESNFSNILKDNDSNFFELKTNQSKVWDNYISAKSVNYKKPHHFGLFINYHNNSNSNIIQEKSDFPIKSYWFGLLFEIVMFEDKYTTG